MVGGGVTQGGDTSQGGMDPGQAGLLGVLSVLGLVCVCGEPLEESWVLEDESRSEEGAAGRAIL